MGPNGSGKTTLLKMLAGEIEPDAGAFTSAPASKIGTSPSMRSKCSNLHLTVWDQEVAYSSDDTSNERVRNLLGAFQFDEETR